MWTAYKMLSLIVTQFDQVQESLSNQSLWRVLLQAQSLTGLDIMQSLRGARRYNGSRYLGMYT